MDILVIEMYLN